MYVIAKERMDVKFVSKPVRGWLARELKKKDKENALVVKLPIISVVQWIK